MGATASADGGMPDTGQLRKMTEKFKRDEGKDAEEDVAKRVFEWPSTPGAGAIQIRQPEPSA